MIHVNFQKRIVALAIMLIATSVTMTVASRSVEQARKEAQKLRIQNGPSRAKAKAGAEYAEPQLIFSKAKGKAKADEAYYYVFSEGDNCGYTIVSGDDRFPAIVGYTESGSYDEDKIPDNFKNFLLAYQQLLDNATEEQIAEIRALKASNSSKTREEVAPLMKSKWGLGGPFNEMFPEYTYTDSEGIERTGKCNMSSAVVAIGEILHYWRCPDHLLAEIPAYNSNENWWPGWPEYHMEAIPEGEVYDWDNMRDEYSWWSEGDEYAVAKLMLHIACANQLHFGHSGLSTAGSIDDRALVKYFGMDNELTRTVSHWGYTAAEWDDLLYNEIVNKRPVYFNGGTTSIAPHGFLNWDFAVHGYKDGLYYVDSHYRNEFDNGGDSGYFDVDLFYDSKVIIGLQPDNGKVDEISDFAVVNTLNRLIFTPVVDNDTKTLSGNVECTFNNYWGLESGTVYVGIGCEDKDGNIVNICQNPLEIKLNELTEKIASFDISFQYEENKAYKLCLIESRDKLNWIRCIGNVKTTAISVKVINGEAILSNCQAELTATVSLDSDNGGHGYAGIYNTLNITLTNSGDIEYHGQIPIVASETDVVPEQPDYVIDCSVPAGGTKTLKINYNPQTAGTYNFWVYDTSDWLVYGNMIGHNSITFTDDVAELVEASCYYDYDDNNMTATITGINNKDIFSNLIIPATTTHHGKTYTVVAIGNEVFKECNGLTEVAIPNSITAIGERAFYDCRNLLSITIPNSVTTIGNDAFDKCVVLIETKVNISDIAAWCNIKFGNWGANPLCFGGHLYINGEEITNLVIPNSVTSIGDYAFDGCSGLASVVIPNSVTSIGGKAFRGCTGLTSVNIPNCVTSVGDGAFLGCSGLTSVTIPNSIMSISNNAFSGCSSLTSLTIPNGVTSIGDRAFANCSGLTSLIIPNSVTSIGMGAFAYCRSLTSVIIPNSVTYIDQHTFSGCTGLTSVTIPNSVTSIGYYAFRGCTGLTSVTIPNSVTYIGPEAFRDCSGLTAVTIPNRVRSIREGAFSGCSSLVEVYSLNITPPYIYNNDSFDDKMYQNATLYVPEEALEAYKNAEGWKKFQNIKGVTITGINGIEADGNDKRNVYYDLNGRRLCAPRKGLNIINGKKVIVK